MKPHSTAPLAQVVLVVGAATVAQTVIAMGTYTLLEITPNSQTVSASSPRK